MQKGILKIGVVGAGHIANVAHLPVLTTIPKTEVVAICDANKDSAQEKARRFKIPRVYSNLSEMLEKEQVDVIDILTPSDTHADMAVMAMQHGYPCILEKPLAITTADADRVIKVAEETRQNVYVTHSLSFSPTMRKVKAIVASGAVGKVVSVHVRFFTTVERENYFAPEHWCHQLPGGTFADLIPHLVMMLLDYLDNVKDVKAIAGKFSQHSHINADELEIIVKAGNGLGSIAFSYNASLTRSIIDIVGTKMSLSVDNLYQTVIRHKPVTYYKPKNTLLEAVYRGFGACNEVFQLVAGLSSTAAKVILRKYNYLDGHRYLIQAALRSIRGEGVYPVDIWKCREAVRILEEVFDSIK